MRNPSTPSRLRALGKVVLFALVLAPLLTPSFAWAAPCPPSLPRLVLLLMATAIALRLEKRRWSTAGFPKPRAFLGGFGQGAGIGLLAGGLLVLLMALAGYRWHLGQPGPAAFALARLVSVAAFEESAFRGYLFFRLEEGLGQSAALGLSAMLFAAMHGLDALLSLPALALAIGALVLGMATLRTRSIAMAMGLHGAWNVTLGAVFGFPLVGHPVPGLLVPEGQGPHWLTGGALGPGSGLLGVLVFALVLGLLLWCLPPISSGGTGLASAAETR